MVHAVAVVSPIDPMFGVLCMPSRRLLLPVLLHDWTDHVPNLAPFIRTWSGQ